MAITAKWYTKAQLAAWSGSPINWTSDTIKVALCTASYVPDQQNHQYFSAITNELSTGNGYTAGGVALASPTATQSSNKVILSAANTLWSNATISARYAVIYKSTGTASSSQLLAYVDFGADFSSTNGPFQITWDPTNGILDLTT